MITDSNIFQIADTNTETLGELLSQLGSILGVGTRTDGRYYLADMCQADSINKWALNKPFRYNSDNFGYDPKNPSVAEAARAAARKAVNQGLVIPSQENAGCSATTYASTYLGDLVYRAENVAGTPNYEYQKPDGSTPNRLRDFDGYRHNASQPFVTGVSLVKADGSGTIPLAADGRDHAVNRFEISALRCYIQMANTNVDISLADLLEGTLGTQFFFTTEKYNGTNRAQQYEYYARIPDLWYKASESISEVDKAGGVSYIDIPLVATDDNTIFDLVLGINKVTQSETMPDEKNRKGFIAPWSAGNFPFRFGIAQSNHPVLDLTPYYGYYFASAASATPSSFSIPSSSMKNAATSNIGVSLKIKKGNTLFYITGANTTAKPSGVRYMFRLVNQGGKTVIGTIVDSNIVSEPTTKYTAITAGSGEQVVYLRFDNMLPNVGDEIRFSILEMSADDGVTWGTLDSGSSLGLYIKRV